MNWYYRVLLSYTPIFFVVVSSVIMVFFTALNHASDRRYTETNQAIVGQIMQNTDANLKLIERNAVSALITDRTLQDYLSDRPKSVYDYYVIQKKLIALKSSFPFACSVYLYDAGSGRILSDSESYRWDDFADRQYLTEAYRQPNAAGWTGPREYAQSLFDRNKQQAVSIVKPYASAHRGAIVVNVYVNSLMADLNEYIQADRGTVHILDAGQRPFQAAPDGAKPSRLRAVSAYTGWTYYADSINAAGYSALSLLSNVWVALVMIVIMLALIWFTVITHVHYRPIQALVVKVAAYAARKSGALGIKQRPLNEFTFINSAIDQLLKKSVDYDSLREAEALHRRRMLIRELLAGHITMTDSEWRRAAGSLELPDEYDRLGAVCVAIDRYGAFVEAFKPGDRHLLKYALENAFRELAQERGMPLCAVWTEPGQIAFMPFLTAAHKPYSETLFQLCEAYRCWIDANLKLTVTVGIGAVSDTMETIAQSFRNAGDNMSYKAVFGTNVVIDNRLAATKNDKDAYAASGDLLETVHLFHKGNGLWRDKLAAIVHELSERRLGRSAVAALGASLAQQLEREIAALSPEQARVWNEGFRDRFDALAEEAETLNELHEGLERVMNELAAAVDKVRKSSGNHAIALRMKANIDANFAEPGLSLAGVSESFGLPVSTASTLFKEETGKKFIDYVLQVRLGHARRLLVETDEPIQSIAEKVGYTHVISFHRAFKKLFGFPPGEYRTIYRAKP